MALAELASMSREHRAHRTYQREVYDRLVRLNKSIWDAKKACADLGVIGELDVKHLIAEIKRIGDIHWASNEEKILADLWRKIEAEDAEKTEKGQNEEVPDVSALESDDYEEIEAL